MALPFGMPWPRQPPPIFPFAPTEEQGGGRLAARMLRILIVEDEALIAMELQHILQSAGHQVLAKASDAESALRLAVEHDPEVVLMDISLGNGPRHPDGIDAAEAIVAATQAAIVFVTAHTDGATLQRIERLGFSEVVRKPFTDASVIAAVNAVTED